MTDIVYIFDTFLVLSPLVPLIINIVITLMQVSNLYTFNEIAAAWSIAGLRCSEHITDALASFHWLRAPECIKFKLAVIVYRALHGAAPQYLSDQLQYVADLLTRRRGRLRSSPRCPPVAMCYCRRSVVCYCRPSTWNSLPADVRSASSLTTFRQKLKTHLFRQSYPDVVL